MIYLGSYNFLYQKLIEIIKNIRKKDKLSKFSFIIFSNTMRKTIKQYVTDELRILHNSEFFTKIDLAKNILKENPINDLEKKILIRIILEENNNYINEIEEEYSEIFQSLKEEKINSKEIPEEISRIYEIYNKKLKEFNIKDREDLITQASNFNFKTDYIFIFGFQSLSLIDRELIKNVINNNKNKNKINIFLPIDVESYVYYNNKYLHTYINFFKDLGFSEIKEENISNKLKLSKLINSKKILQNNFINDNSLKFIKVKGQKQEIIHLAKYILFLKEEKNVSFSKIGIIVNDIENYIDDIKEIFQDYKIPYYLSKENKYIDDINFKKIFSIFSLKVNDFKRDDLLNSLSTDILNISELNINELEKKLIENSFDKGLEKLSNILEEELLNIFIELNEIKTEEDLNYFLDFFKNFIDKNFKENIYKNKILDILNQIKNSIFFNKIEKINLRNFNKIILRYLEQENKENRMTGEIVEILTPSIALGSIFEHLFFIDMNDRKYPFLKDDNFIINKYEELKELISKKDIVYSQQILTFINLFNSSKNNYLFYKETNDNGDYLSPSILVEELLMYNCNGNYQETGKEFLNKTTLNEFKLKNANYFFNSEFNKLIEMNNKIESNDLSEYEGFFSNNLLEEKKLTPSQLQTYINCPYKFFIQYIISPKKLKVYDLEKIPYDKFGEIIHKILEEIYKNYSNYKKNNYLLKEFINNKFIEYFTPIFNELNKSSVYFEKIKVEQLKENLFKFIRKDLSDLEKNNYEVYSLEYEVYIRLNDYEIKGRIDRIDKNLNNNSYNIYDYKISKKRNIDLEKEIKKGKFIQLYLYKKSLENCNYKIDKLGILFLKELGNNIKQIVESNIIENENIKDKVESAINLIDKSFFSPYTESEDCCCCSYSYICGKKYRDEKLKEKFTKNESGNEFLRISKNEQ